MSSVFEIYVILPTYNNEKTIKRAIDSVLNQDYEGHLHLIVVPNGCTDKTEDIVIGLRNDYYDVKKTKGIKNRILTYLPSPKGVVTAFNRGLDYARRCHNEFDSSGKQYTDQTWFCRMDGDDAWYPDKIRKQVEFIQNNPDVDVIGAQMRYVTSNEYKPFGYTSNPEQHHEIYRSMISGANVIANPVAICRWTVLDKAGRLEEIFPYAEDYWFWLKALLTGYKFSNMPDVLMDYTYEPKPHENPEIGQRVAQAAQFVYAYNQRFRK